MDYFLPEIKINRAVFKENLQRFLSPFGRCLVGTQSRALIYCAVFLLVLKIFSIAVFLNFSPNIFFADITKGALINMVNQSRESAGIGGLSENIKLDQAAELKAEDMVQKQYFSHNSPDGTTPWHWFSKIGYDYKYAGENLAVGFFDSVDVFHAWLNSPLHRENILNPKYQEVGTAVLKGFGPNNAIVVVQLFGTLKSQQNLPLVPAQNTEPEKADEPPVQISSGENKSSEKVLSQYSENISFFEKMTGNSGDSFYLKFVNFISYENTEFLQYLIYMFLLISAGSAASSLYMSQQKHRRELLLRSFLAFIIFLSALLLNKEMLFLISTPEILI